MSNPVAYRLNQDNLDRMLGQLRSHELSGKPVYIRMGWSDLHGIVRGVTIPLRHAQSFMTNGHSAFAGKYWSLGYLGSFVNKDILIV